jgi:two-component system cell cycle response regulator
MKILVADDDRVSLRLRQRTLELSGYEVITVADGLEALEELSKPDGPRLALVDWMMPKLDGLGLCRQVRKMHSDAYVYIVLLTARETSEDIVAGLEAGADDYLTKPCQPAELKARLHTGKRVLQLEDNLVRAREEMRFKATHDALTGLWDRGAIVNLLQRALTRSLQESFPVSLLLCDVDHFKRINDVHGHVTGDEVLREVSARLVKAVRSTDSVGRYGGEEFLVILNGCPQARLEKIAEQMRMTVGGEPISTSQGSLTVTMSLGAITIDTWDDASPIELLLHEVDSALYAAKRAGRDRVMYAQQTTLFAAD